MSNNKILSFCVICLVIANVFSHVKECTLLQCFAYGCVGICRVSYFDSVRDYLLSGI